MQGVQCISHLPVPAALLQDEAGAKLQMLAAEEGRSAEQMALKWNAQRGVPVLVPSTSEMLNCVDFSSWRLSEGRSKV